MPDRMVPGSKTENHKKKIQNGHQIQDGRQNVRRHLYFLPFRFLSSRLKVCCCLEG